METSNRNLNGISFNIDKNKTNINNKFIISKLNNENNKINNYPNTLMRHRSPNNNGTKYPINNVQINHGKILTENNQINNLNNILNDQNIDILNMDLIPRNTNQHPKIIIQKKTNKEQNRQKFININSPGKNILKNRINDIQEQKENREKKGNYQYIIKNVKKINHPMKSEKKEINDLNNNKIKNDEEESAININQIREELISIHDNRKYNYDKKVQKINPAKIPIPQGKKLVERILGIRDKKENKDENKEENKKLIEFKTASKFNVESLPEYNIPKEILHKQKMINDNNPIDVSPLNLRQNIKIIKVLENNNTNSRNQPQNFISQNTNYNKNYTIQNISFNTPHKQNIEKTQNNNSNIEPINHPINQINEETKHIKQLNGILIPPPTNNLKNATILPQKQIINNNPQQTLTIVQKLSPKKIWNQNILKSNPNMKNLNSNKNKANIISIKPEPQNNDAEYFDKDSDEPKNSDEISNEQVPNINKDIQPNINITVKKITPLLREQSLNITPIKRINGDLVQNRQIIHQNLNANNGLIQNVRKIQPQNKNEFQQQEKINKLQQNMNVLENKNNIIQNNNKTMRNNINYPQDMNKIINPNIINQNNNPTINNVPQNTNIPEQQNFATVKKILPQQIPNNEIIGNIIIKDGKAYYLNPPQNQNINSNIINNNIPQPKPNLQMIQNNQMPNQAPQNQIYKQIINNQIIYRDQNGNIINIPKPIQQANSQAQLRNQQNVVKKKKLSRVARLLQSKDTNDRKPALQYKVERNRPLYAVPPSKKRAVSQGKPFTLINKYYDENYILEDDEEGDEKNEDINNIHIEKKFE